MKKGRIYLFKNSQLGVDTIIPMNSKRVIVKLDEKKRESRVSRWRRVALSASKQSSRNTITDITSIRDFREVLNSSESFDLKIIPTLAGERKSLKSIFRQGDYKKILVLIGPEGDFTDDEISLAKRRGFIPITLGDLVLRVDTAAVAVASFIRFNENG